MTEHVIEIEGLRKEYRRRRGTIAAVAGLDLAVPAGGVFGFLGPNGSGKTTTIRCLLGLVRPTAGTLRLAGHAVPDDLAAALRTTGAIVEMPALFPTMSGRENLVLLGAMDRIGPRRVDEVLEQVGLSERGGDAVGKYSLGMRQRLGLAAALLKDPALLILDEPANGLDPAGMRSVRELLGELAAEGRTVFVSSHLLTEIEHTCDQVAILHRGRCVRTGRVDDIRASGRGPSILVAVGDPVGAIGVLEDAGMVAEIDDGRVRVALPGVEAGRVNRTLGERGHWVTELRVDERDLEDVFLELTGERSDEPVAGPIPVELEEVR